MPPKRPATGGCSDPRTFRFGWAIGLDGKRGAPTSIGWDVLENKLLAGARPVGPADGFGNGGLNGSVSAVPEPQGALMLAAGLAVLMRRRQRRA